MRIFFYQTRQKAPFPEDMYPLGGYEHVILSNARNTKLDPIVTLLYDIAKPTSIPPNDNYLFLIPLGVKNQFITLLNNQFHDTVWIEYLTTTMPAIEVYGDDKLSQFYETFKTPITVLQIMSPEHKKFFLAGTRFYELLTKQAPYQPPKKPSEYNPNCSKQLDKVVLKALKLEATECFRTVTEFGEALVLALNDPVKPIKKSGKLPGKILSVVVLVLILSGSFILGMRYYSCPPPPPLPCEANVTTSNPKDYAALLVSCLESQIPAQQHIYINPLTLFVSGEQKQHVDVFDSLLRDALTDNTRFEPLNPKQLDSDSLNLDSLRQRAKRETSIKGMSLLADLLNADSELKGEVRLNEKQIHVEITLTNKHTEHVADATVEFFSKNNNILTQEKITQANNANPINPPSQLEIATSHGVHNVTYLANEKIRLFIRTNKSAYVYVFVVDNQHVTYLYPQKLHTLGKLVQLQKFKADELFIIPDDGLPFDIAAQAPFGESTFWVVASTNLLEFPADKDDSWHQINTLRPKVRQLGLANSKGYAEAELVVKTIGPSNNGN